MDVYVMKEGRRTGPYQPFRLREMLEEGTLLPADPVWHEGMDNWQPLNETDSLTAVVGRPPPQDSAPDKTDAAAETESALSPDTRPQPPPVPSATASRALPENPEAALAILQARRVLATRRFFARHIDMLLAAIVTVAAATAMGHADVWELHSPNTIYILLAPAFVWMLLEPFILLIWGTTPGKAALGLRVESATGERLTLRQTLLRSVLVWAGGMGFGVRTGDPLPVGQILPVAQWGYSWWMLQRRGTTLWDHTSRTTIHAITLRRRHGFSLAFAATVFIGVHVWLVLAAPLPPRMTTEERTMIEDFRKRFWQPGD